MSCDLCSPQYLNTSFGEKSCSFIWIFTLNKSPRHKISMVDWTTGPDFSLPYSSSICPVLPWLLGGRSVCRSPTLDLAAWLVLTNRTLAAMTQPYLLCFCHHKDGHWPFSTDLKMRHLEQTNPIWTAGHLEPTVKPPQPTYKPAVRNESFCFYATKFGGKSPDNSWLI